jgi:hypothetical protein
MKLSLLKNQLHNINEISILQPNGEAIPAHFHITELGLVTKHFIDCGGTVRMEKTANLQLWIANDTEHRLTPTKLLKIIDLSKPLLGDEDLDVEVEYQTDTISKYGLEIAGNNLVLTTKQTACLAEDACAIPPAKQKIQLANLGAETAACCAPGGSCC